jgi:hypothetical protein
MHLIINAYERIYVTLIFLAEQNVVAVSYRFVSHSDLP